MLTESQANIVWDVLVEFAAAQPLIRREFVTYATTRNKGQFNCGYGTLYLEREGPRMDTFPGDDNPERLAAIEKANLALAAHWKL